MSRDLRLYFFLVLLAGCYGSVLRSYREIRENVIQAEQDISLGSNLTLSPDETLLNGILMGYKNAEYNYGLETTNFTAAMQFYYGKEALPNSEVFKIIQRMPKGANLHIHELALTSADFVVKNLTYREGLYVCGEIVESEKQLYDIQFIFASSAPADLTYCKWELLSTRRSASGNPEYFDGLLKRMLILSHPEIYTNINEVWRSFENRLGMLSGIVLYAPAFVDFFYQGLLEFYQDNVMYVEIRTTIPQAYLLDGSLLSQSEVLGLYETAFERFVNDHPDSMGAKIIFAPTRRVSQDEVAHYIDLTAEFQKTYPNLVVGFDLVGQEDLGYPLVDFSDVILNGSATYPDMRFFFHAGETDWEGTSTDENIFDAILFNTTRIGHGYAIAKHPLLKSMARAKNIPIEVCPISNNVLKLVSDLRNHPVSTLISEGFPMVISADDPASWGSKGLSADMYMAFMALAGQRADLRLLKQLAINSIEYSALPSLEKEAAWALWENQWDIFVKEIIQSHQLSKINTI